MRTTTPPVLTPDDAMWFSGWDGGSDSIIYRYDTTGDTIDDTGDIANVFDYAPIARCDNSCHFTRDPSPGSEIAISYDEDLVLGAGNATVGTIIPFRSSVAHDNSYVVLFNYYDVYEWEC